MTKEQCQEAMEKGAALVRDLDQKGCNILGLGEMGIGNTSSAAILMSLLCGIPLQECVGRGAGIDGAGWQKKLDVLTQAIANQPVSNQPLEVLRTFGGFEIAMMTGAFLQATERKMVILVDGFIATSALLVASQLEPNVLGYCLFSHVSDEAGHRALLKRLGAKPLLNLQMRLGEGSGAAIAYPLVVSAVQFLIKMASFASAGVSQKQE